MEETHYPKFRRRTTRKPNQFCSSPQQHKVIPSNGRVLGLTLFLLLLAIDTTHGQDYASNEVTPNRELTEVDGGEIVGERTLRLAESPFLLRSDLEVAFGGRLIVEPGVVVHVAPMVGITVRGALQAVVSIDGCQFFNFMFHIYNRICENSNILTIQIPLCMIISKLSFTYLKLSY